MAKAYNFKVCAKICRGCGAEFQGHSNRKYCGEKCRDNSEAYKAVKQFKRISNLPFFLTEKLKLAKHRGKYSVTLTVQDLQNLWDKQSGKCALSGVPMTYTKGSGRIPTNLSMDRIDSTLPYQLGNVQLVCYQANLMKSELGVAELRFWCERILHATQLQT
jgi:hypothetical protein